MSSVRHKESIEACLFKALSNIWINKLNHYWDNIAIYICSKQTVNNQGNNCCSIDLYGITSPVWDVYWGSYILVQIWEPYMVSNTQVDQEVTSASII